MPELPEVERAAGLIRSLAENKVISCVETVEDRIVFSGTSSQEFANEITGRVVKSVGRYGKVFYLELSGSGKMPVFHFGMTGNLQVKGALPLQYGEGTRKISAEWPPRFMKLIMHLRAVGATSDTEEVQIAFMDARRLGRVRLCQTPLAEPPISNMGFDPIHGMPPLEDFRKKVLKRTCPIKALLLDQSFSAGVGNWVADEILYHARVHPEQRCNTISREHIAALHRYTLEVCQFAVSVNADDSKFPDNWIFKHRWGKGKSKRSKQHPALKLPSGEPATIKWVTVGGRTSAYVVELQKLYRPVKSTDAEESQEREVTESDLSPVSESDTELIIQTRSVANKRKHDAESTLAARRQSKRLRS